MEVKINTYRRFENLIGRKFGKLTITNGPLNIIDEKEWSLLTSSQPKHH